MRLPEADLDNEYLSSDTQTTTLQNILFQEAFQKVADECERRHLPLVALKGISFFGRIYDSSERSLTDIDVFVAPVDLPEINDILLSQGYKERAEEKWSANSYKYIYFKFHLGLEIVLEVHTQLISDPNRDQWHCIDFKNFKILASEDELLYLAYHYALQHTLLKSKWLHDIYLLTKNSPSLWSESLWIRAKQKGIYSALLFTAHAINLKYKLNLSLPKSLKTIFAKNILNLEFIENPDQFLLKYYVTKHAVKDSFSEAIMYDVHWLYFAIKKRFVNESES